MRSVQRLQNLFSVRFFNILFAHHFAVINKENANCSRTWPRFAGIFAALAVSLPNNVPPCAAVVQLSLPAIAVTHDGTHHHTDHARPPWWAFFLCFFVFFRSKRYRSFQRVWGEQKFFKFSCFRGFETSAFLAYCQRKVTTLSSRTLKMKTSCVASNPSAGGNGRRHFRRRGRSACGACWERVAPFDSELERRRFITASGVLLIALPTPGASKTGAEEGYTGEEPQGLLIFRAKATAEGYTGCSIRMYAWRRYAQCGFVQKPCRTRIFRQWCSECSSYIFLRRNE